MPDRDNGVIRKIHPAFAGEELIHLTLGAELGLEVGSVDTDEFGRLPNLTGLLMLV